MARQLRLEFEGALYHVMARGNARAAIFRSDKDRSAFLTQVGRACERFDWRIWAWCLMDNHYHLLVETIQPTLSRGMREINGVYTQAFNRRHDRVGHVLQGRYKSVVIDKDNYLLELSRYVVLNPVRAGAVKTAGQWRWSSYRAVVGKTAAPSWLAVEATLGLFHAQSGPARQAYARFVAQGVDAADPMDAVERQSLLGSEAFVARMAHLATQSVSKENPRRVRVVPSLATIERQAGGSRDKAIRAAYASGGYTLGQIGAHFGLHYATISRIARDSTA